MDLVVRQSGGGPLFYFDNRFPAKNWLAVTLRGTRGNSAGIGARLVAEVAGRKIVREMYPHNGFFSQAPNRVHFGLGDAAKVDRLTIRWPNGEVQELKDVAGNRHVVVTEGSADLTTATGSR
jgi:enediyne biosynthesis protein E4